MRDSHLRELRCVPAPAKINWFLHVTGRRADGYHELQTIFQLIDLCDELDFVLERDHQILHCNPIAGVDPDKDLVIRAARLLQAATGCQSGVRVSVRKRIPLGAGLGGGSSDAATTLLALNRLWKTGLTRSELARLGVRLGADIPFFIHGENALATGIGERLQPVKLANASLLLAMPATSVPTASIFQDPELTRDTAPLKIAGFPARGKPLRLDSAMGRNDLEAVAVKQFPLVGETLQALRHLCRHPKIKLDPGAVRMSGSGACVFAWCDSAEQATEMLHLMALHEADKPKARRASLQVVTTLERHPFQL